MPDVAERDRARDLDDERAGSASGALATTQALGNSLGVAITGVIFFAAADQGLDHAFELSAAQFALVGVAVAALTRLLPKGRLRQPT